MSAQLNTHISWCRISSGKAPCTCESTRYLQIALVTALIIAVQLTGWYFSGSISLLSDTAHVAFDGVAALISYSVARYVEFSPELPKSEERRIRHKCMRLSGVLLLVGLGFIVLEAYERYLDPTKVIGSSLFVAATLGLLGNIWQHRLLPHQHTSTSEIQKTHIHGDLWSSVAVILAGIIIWGTGWDVVDPVAAGLVVLIIGWNTISMMIRPPETGCH